MSLSVVVVAGMIPVDPPFEIRKRASLVDGAVVLLIMRLPACLAGSVLIKHLAMRVNTLMVCCSVGGARGSCDGL